MPRPLRVDAEGALHHVFDRGNRRQVICEDDLDYRLFLWLLELAARRFNWLVHAYCVMPNHYHLLIETPQAGLSRGMQLLNGRYAQAFNSGRRVDGHLFQGRFGSVLVETESHAIWVNRYIARNPVEAGLVPAPAAWAWSSYGALRRGAAPSWLAHDAVLRLFGEGEAAAVTYERLILDEEGPDLPGHVRGLTYMKGAVGVAGWRSGWVLVVRWGWPVPMWARVGAAQEHEWGPWRLIPRRGAAWAAPGQTGAGHGLGSFVGGRGRI